MHVSSLTTPCLVYACFSQGFKVEIVNPPQDVINTIIVGSPRKHESNAVKSLGQDGQRLGVKGADGMKRADASQQDCESTGTGPGKVQHCEPCSDSSNRKGNCKITGIAQSELEEEELLPLLQSFPGGGVRRLDSPQGWRCSHCRHLYIRGLSTVDAAAAEVMDAETDPPLSATAGAAAAAAQIAGGLNSMSKSERFEIDEKLIHTYIEQLESQVQDQAAEDAQSFAELQSLMANTRLTQLNPQLDTTPVLVAADAIPLDAPANP